MTNQACTNQVNVEDLKLCVARIKELRSLEKKAGQAKSDVSAQLHAEEEKALAMLSDAELKNFRCDSGTIGMTERLSVKTPKLPEDRDAFFAYLRDRGLFDQMISVNSATLNSFYKSEFEQAKERGDAEFKIPGINEETINIILTFRGE